MSKLGTAATTAAAITLALRV